MESASTEKKSVERRALANETAIESDKMKTEAIEILEVDPKIEDRVLRKQDYHILPWLFGIWLCAFIDRSNIGNARIDGLTEDLHLLGTEFNVALGKNSDPFLDH